MDLESLTDEEKYFALSGDTTSHEFRKQLRIAIPFVNEFCKKYGIIISGIGVTMEEGYYEVCYSFTDNLGYYTLQGLKNSLQD